MATKTKNLISNKLDLRFFAEKILKNTWRWQL